MTPEAREKWMESRVVHGAYMDGVESRTHYIWRSMMSRCTNPHNKDYKSYGGRGIKVCLAWQKYENFLADMGDAPPDKSIDRVDVNGDYEMGNCRWATRSEQQKNKTTTKIYGSNEFTGTLVEVAQHLGISKSLALWRFKTWGTFIKGEEWQLLSQK